MKAQSWFSALLVIVASATGSHVVAQHAVNVVSYDAGATPAPGGFTVASAALGEPARFTGLGAFPGAVTPFNPPYLTSEIVSIGEGGQLTLRLSHFVLTQGTAPHLGVFTNVGLIETDFPNGQAGNPVGTFGVDSAVVEVSADGALWQNLGELIFDIPTNGYTDLASPFSEVPGTVESDFLKPFAGTLSDFNGLRYAPEMLSLLNGSAGGKWLDLSGVALSQVGYVRFSVPDDGDAGTSLNFEIDGVAISRAAVGTRVPEPGMVVLMLTHVNSVFRDQRCASSIANRTHLDPKGRAMIGLPRTSSWAFAARPFRPEEGQRWSSCILPPAPSGDD
jgi:hypothetical protein